jgi:pimeloyl-ACP methyl ester carboxylesterase
MNQSKQRREIDLPSGRIRYREAGEGKPVVFVHGYLVDGRLWDGVVDSLSDRCRCLAPDWPIGAQQVAMKPDADLSPYGIAATIASFLEALDLEDVTIVGNDSGGAMSQVLVTRRPERIGRLVLTNCDTHENFPPGPFKTMPPIAKLPGGMAMLAAPFRIPALARAAFKPFARTPIPADLIASWMEPGLHDADVKRDVKKVTT